ncbi:MAG: MFS transporter [Rhodopila sp.]
MTAATASTVQQRHIASVFFPFASGYLMSYLFRTVNGPLGERLIAEFHLNAGQLGLLTSVYFLAFATSQLPLGLAIDHYGPRRVQIALCLVAAAGALMFAAAGNMATLILGRTLIGVGTAAGLVAGLKALNMAVPHHRLMLMNGFYITCGGLGAMAGTYPVSWAADHLGWRGTFVGLAAMTVVVAVAFAVVVPHQRTETKPEPWRQTLLALVGICRTAVFWRLAPLSASVIGSAFAIHGLWAARWMTDVDGMAQRSVTLDLLIMGVGLAAGATTLGAIGNWLRARGVSTAALFAGACGVFLLIETLILLHIRVPELLLWPGFAMFGAMTVLSYSMLSDLFPQALIGRANSALNVMHLSMAFLLQMGLGAIASRWAPNGSGHYPIVAYRWAFALPIGLQMAALAWFLLAPMLRAEDRGAEARPAPGQ